MLLKAENLSYTYQPGTPYESKAISDINLEINAGDYLAIIGHTGSGKSTLAQCLNGLIKPTGGRVTLDDMDINAQGTDKRKVRCRIGLVFQYPETQLFEETVYKDISFGPRNMGLSEEEIKTRVARAMETVGLDQKQFAEKSPFELSGGQMRRCAIAGILAMEPDVLILDEPTAGLDPAGKKELLDEISALHKNGSTIVMITHNMDDVANYATRAAVISHGRLIYDDTPANVFAHGDQLISLGLDVPQATRLGMKLRARGIPFPEDIITEKEAIEALKKIMGKGAEK